MMKATRWVIMIATLAGQIGCAAMPKMSSGLPIEIDTAPGTPRYTQEGHGIDAGDMTEQLKKEPAAEPHVSRAQGLRIAALLFAAAGGALIGVPLGQKLGGSDKPLWVLAGVGAGSIGVSIPFTVGSIYSMDRAVDAHNHPSDK